MNVGIYDAFAPKVQAFADGKSPPLEVSYPGLSFEPPSQGIWLELLTFWNGREEYGLGADGPASTRGFFRVLVNSRPGQGINAAADIAEELIAAIPKGTVLGPAIVDRTPALSSGPIEGDNRVFQTTTFRWVVTP